MKRYAIIGPPNVGKSALFYALTGVFVKTANYPGTTLELQKGVVKKGSYSVELVDLPGVFNPDSPIDEDEKLAIKEALEGAYDGVIVVAAPHVLKQGLRLAEIISARRPVILVFNMADLWKPPYTQEELSKLLSVPVVFTSAVTGEGVAQLRELLFKDVPKSSLRLQDLKVPEYAVIKSAILSRPPIALATLLALGVLTTIFLMAVIEGVTPWGGNLPVSLASFFDFLDQHVSQAVMALIGGPAGRFITEALWESVLTLLILSVYVIIAFTLIVLYEDSGLIALLSKSVERRLSYVGIPPRGVVCLFVAASCNVPAAITAKALWGRGSRVLTALLTPYVPCVARLAIFVAVAAAALSRIPYLIPVAVFIPYLISFGFALIASFIYRKALGIKTEAIGIVPPAPLMWPRWYIYFKKVAVSYKEFILKVGPLLSAVIIALWPLRAYGPGGYVEDISQSYLAAIGNAFEPLFKPMGLPWQVVMPLIGGWVFKEVVLGLLEATGGLQIISTLPLSSIMAFLVFTAFYSACIATLSVLYRTVGLKLTALSVVVNLAMAYIAALAVYAALSLVPL
ncbi:ferrous iron transporter B [Pyrobaculum aerophilum]|uniref:ferrous iron transporter B n=1 Tax=Pyrobaculum aerophilum TaxID=13773 RepID=UPI0021620AAB|nr:ferrous iron transporter B [Pyrobaculum aerophilum]